MIGNRFRCRFVFPRICATKKPAVGSSQRVPIEVTIRPRGRIRKVQIFQSRAKRVVKALRSYFAAD